MNENEEYLIDNVIILHKEHIVESSNESFLVCILLLMLLLTLHMFFGSSFIDKYGSDNYVTVTMICLCVIMLVFIAIDKCCTKLSTRFRYTVAVLEGADIAYIQNNYYVGEKRGKMWVISDKKPNRTSLLSGGESQ